MFQKICFRHYKKIPGVSKVTILWIHRRRLRRCRQAGSTGRSRSGCTCPLTEHRDKPERNRRINST